MSCHFHSSCFLPSSGHGDALPLVMELRGLWSRVLLVHKALYSPILYTLRNFVSIKVLQLTTACQTNGAQLRYDGAFRYGENKCLDTTGDGVLTFSSDCTSFQFVGKSRIRINKRRTLLAENSLAQ